MARDCTNNRLVLEFFEYEYAASSESQPFEKSGYPRRACGFDKQFPHAAQANLRYENLLVAHDVDAPCDSSIAARLVPAGWISDSNLLMHRLGFLDRPVVKNWRRTGSLKPIRSAFCGTFDRILIPISRPVGGDVSGITDGQQMKIGRVSQNIDDFKRSGLLPRDPIRIRSSSR